jgi:glutamate dehydrogenase (NAD(P)+)
LGRKEATGKGVYFSFRYLMHDFLRDNKGWLAGSSNIFAATALAHADKPLTIAVQGFGNVGSVTAMEAYKCTAMRGKVVAVSDRSVTLYNEDGLDIPSLIAYAGANRGDLPATEAALQECGARAQILDREAVLYLDVNVLFLAALEDQIRKDNAEKVKARIIVEGANAPITGDADEELAAKGIVIIPDILANAGGVIVSYFEWLQGRETQFYSEDEIYKQLYAKMQKTMNSILPAYFGDPLPLRQNCFVHAVMKLSSVLYRQGKLY